MQVPAMAAMTGLSAASTTRIAVRNVGSAVALGALNSLMSALCPAARNLSTN